MAESTPDALSRKITTFQDVEPGTEQTDTVKQILLDESKKHTPLNLRYDVNNAINRMFFNIGHSRMDLLLDDNGTRYRVAHKSNDGGDLYDDNHPPTEMLPAFHIHDKKLFLQHLVRIQERSGAIRGKTKWADAKHFTDFWNNATPQDFQQPERFLQEQFYALEHPTFDLLKDDIWSEAGKLPDLDLPFYIRNTQAYHASESAYELQFRVGEEEVDQIASVRYARTDFDTVTIYAIQMPWLNGTPQRIAERNLAEGKGDKEKLEALLTQYKERREKMKQFNPYLGRTIKNDKDEEIGHVPDDLAGVSPSTLISFVAALALINGQEITQVRIPTYLPWRVHKDPEGKIDKGILEQNIRLARRAAFEVFGVEVQSLGEEDHYIHLQLGEQIKSDRPLLAHVISSAKTLTPY